jgi:hypothetical protein
MQISIDDLIEPLDILKAMSPGDEKIIRGHYVLWDGVTWERHFEGKMFFTKYLRSYCI